MVYLFKFVEGVKEVEAKWIGWAGVNVPDEPGQRSLTKALAEKVPCFLKFKPCLHLNDKNVLFL